MLWEDKCRYFKQPIGIPLHALLLGYIQGCKDSVDAMLAIIEAMSDRHDSCDGLSLDQIIGAVREALLFLPCQMTPHPSSK